LTSQDPIADDRAAPSGPFQVMRTLLVLLCAVAAADSFVVTGVRMPVMRSALTEYRTEAPKAIIG
jgi:hypothetical protein